MASCVRHVNTFKTILTRLHRIGPKVSSLQTLHNCLHTRTLSAHCVSRSLLQTYGRLPIEHLHKPGWIYAAIGVRYNSTENIEAATGYIPEPPPLPVSDLTTLVADQAATLNALGEPTLASLGLAQWTPPGCIQSMLETFHVFGGLPWWGSIVATTVILRLLVFPLVVKSQKNAANMSNHMPTVQRLQEKFTKARQGGNQMDAAKAAQELMDYMKRNNVTPMKNVLVPMAQLPIFLSVFIGIRKMANLPVHSMTTGGIWWFTDLTIADPYYALPIMTMATFLITLELGADGMKSANVSPVLRIVMRAMPFIMLPMIMNFPTAMLCYWLTANVFSLSQVMFLKIPEVRNFFQIPRLVKHEKSHVAKKKGFVAGFKDTISNAKLASEMENREQMEASRFKKAGKGPLVKTYKHNPKSVRSKSS